DPLVAHHRLEQVLVHAERRGGVVGADVGHAGHLQQPLQPAVLAERPVEDRQDDLDARQRRRDLRGRGRNGQLWTVRSRDCPWAYALRDGSGGEGPAAAAVDLDGDRLVAVGVEGVDHRPRGRDRDRVLRGPAAHQDRDPPPRGHGNVVVSVAVVSVVTGSVLVVVSVVTGAT